MVLGYQGTLAPWNNGTMVPCPWYHGTMVPRCLGTTTATALMSTSFVLVIAISLSLALAFVTGVAREAAAITCIKAMLTQARWALVPVGVVRGTNNVALRDVQTSPRRTNSDKRSLCFWLAVNGHCHDSIDLYWARGCGGLGGIADAAVTIGARTLCWDPMASIGASPSTTSQSRFNSKRTS